MRKALSSSMATDGADARRGGGDSLKWCPVASLGSLASSPVSLSQILRAGGVSQGGASDRAPGVVHSEPRQDASMGHGASCFKPATSAAAPVTSSSTAASTNCSVTSFTPLQHSQHFIRNPAQHSNANSNNAAKLKNQVIFSLISSVSSYCSRGQIPLRVARY